MTEVYGGEEKSESRDKGERRVETTVVWGWEEGSVLEDAEDDNGFVVEVFGAALEEGYGVEDGVYG